MQKTNIFIISGPSGAGEDSIINGLEKYFPIRRVVTTTTRDMRQGEKQGSPYRFISKEEFAKDLKEGKFVEYAEQYNGNFYGVTFDEIVEAKKTEKISIWKIEYKGVEAAKKIFPEIKSIFVDALSLDVLEKRISRRDNVSVDYINERMNYTKEWLKHTNIYDFRVINEEGKLNEAIKQVAEIIKNNS